MYPVSEAYLQAIQQHTIATRWSGTLKTRDGVEYEITPSTICEGGGKLTRQLCPSKDLTIGATCSAQLDLKLNLQGVSRYTLMHATVSLTHSLRLQDGSWEDVPLGIFEVTEPPERAKDVLTIHAYDNMQKFNEDFDATLVGKPYDIITHACRVCGVELGTSQSEILNMPNGSVETWNLADIRIYTWRDLIGFMASFLCCNAICGPDGKLYMLPYRMEADRSIPPSWRWDYTPTDYECYFTSLTHYFHISQEYESVILGPGGLDYDLGENPFIQFNADEVRRSVLTAIINRLAEAMYTPFKGKFPVDPSIMPGDVLEFSGNHAVEGKLSVVTKQVITLHRGMTLECNGDDPNLNVLTEQEKRLRTAAKNSNKDGMFYYDFINATDVTIGDGQRAKVIEFHYTTTKRTHVDFHAELKCLVETSEDYDAGSGTYIEPDGVVEVTYYQGGDPVTAYYPVDLLTDGTQLMHLLYTWWASSNIVSSFEVHIKCIGCSITIPAGAARGYMAGPGLVGEVNWDGTLYIYDKFPPVDFATVRKKFTGDLEPILGTPTAPTLLDRVRKHNFLRTVAKKFKALLVQHVASRFSVPYNDEEMEKVSVETVGGVWANADPAVDGTVTTPNTTVPRILQVRSWHTSSSGDVTYVASFDDGETWWYWSDGWTPYEGGYGMVESTMVTIPAKQWKAKLMGQGKVRIRAILEKDASLTDMQIITSTATDWDAPSHLQLVCDEYYIVKSRDRTVLRYEWLYRSEEVPIDVGRMSAIDIDTTAYGEVTEIYAHAHVPGDR